MCNNVFIYLSSNLNLQYIVMAEISHAARGHTEFLVYCSSNNKLYKPQCYICKFQTSNGFKETMFICEWTCEYALCNQSFLHLLNSIFVLFVFTFYKNISQTLISQYNKILAVKELHWL
jgi:hypothetical protein